MSGLFARWGLCYVEVFWCCWKYVVLWMLLVSGGCRRLWVMLRPLEVVGDMEGWLWATLTFLMVVYVQGKQYVHIAQYSCLALA
jgi:hypothetical protein